MNTTLITCEFCNKVVERNLSKYNTGLKRGQKNWFCSKPCMNQYHRVETDCFQCGEKVCRNSFQAAKSKNLFCSLSCAAIYNNTHKTKGTRRSKLEKYLEEQLNQLFPTLEIMFNCKDIIDSELDIYIPQLRLAIELNGIYHFKPIYGERKLKKIQDNDVLKIEACSKKQITLVTINTSNQKQWNQESSKEFLTSVTEIVKSYLG
jgi:hypothetical protein